MKRLIQFCTMLALVAAFTVAANAQTERRFDTKIPFSFNIGQKSYQAGDYTIKVSKLAVGAVTVSLENRKGKHLQTFPVLTNGEVLQGKPHLLFTRYEEQSFLTRILTAEKGFTIPTSKAEKQIAGKTRNNDLKKQVAVAYLNR